MANKNASLSFDKKTVDLPIYQPTLGKQVIDVTQLGANGAYTFDPGFKATAACKSDITFIDGEKGELLYRGYPIDQLAENASFIEVCYLLLHGELPNQSQLDAFETNIKDNIDVDPIIENIFKGFKKDAEPMAMMIALTGGLAGLYHDEVDITKAEDRIDVAIKLIAKIPTLTAMCKRHNAGEKFIKPRKDLTYAENFLHMLSSKSDKDEPNKVIAHALDTIFILHADHEQNASTSTVRLAGSTGTDAYAAFSAGIAALWGPAHGGANEAALKMLEKIEHPSHIDEFVAKAKDKKDPFRLMGFGHRVYKNYDPRAKVMQKICHDILAETGVGDSELFKTAVELEKIALEDPYFIDRKLYPNVDFYSGITQSAIGIPSNLFTVIFTLGRTPGWMSHWHEMLSNPYNIGRPRQLYTGAARRDFVEMASRK